MHCQVREHKNFDEVREFAIVVIFRCRVTSAVNMAKVSVFRKQKYAEVCLEYGV